MSTLQEYLRQEKSIKTEFKMGCFFPSPMSQKGFFQMTVGVIQVQSTKPD